MPVYFCECIDRLHPTLLVLAHGGRLPISVVASSTLTVQGSLSREDVGHAGGFAGHISPRNMQEVAWQTISSGSWSVRRDLQALAQQGTCSVDDNLGEDELELAFLRLFYLISLFTLSHHFPHFCDIEGQYTCRECPGDRYGSGNRAELRAQLLESLENCST